eukprot:CAMPEP_0184325814 /NCGR_PEP_ID=MMETSP1049-20130417/142230_1 /TAXON_ID=77928 /ORGANISM="Proteomonas sulcata, Strain CCMP704" /LENGTH=141 /DNA_ID=CAMNT_0026647973 /DNA_START=1862 /DNA_END=2287 /DNA_ORIENTATION=-
MTVTEGDNGKACVTLLRILQKDYFQGRPVSLVLLEPLTGRRHQLRVHMLALGHPIVGDATYTRDFQSPRMMLHAWMLHFPPSNASRSGHLKGTGGRAWSGLAGHEQKGITFVADDPLAQYIGYDGTRRQKLEGKQSLSHGT